MWNNEVNYELEGKDGTRITCTTLQVIKNLVSRIERDYEETNQSSENIMLPFEFIIGSLFPNCYNNIKDTITQSYIEGYAAGVSNTMKEIEAENDKT